MASFIDCKYEEDLVAKLEQLSEEVFQSPDMSEDFVENIDVLNENTEALNSELKNFRKLRNDLAKSNRISPSLKAKIRDEFIPNALLKEYDSATIASMQNLIDFVLANSQFFPNPFNETQLLDLVTRLDPILFKTFESEFPSIALRLNSGPISAAEVNSLIRENGLDSRFFASQVRGVATPNLIPGVDTALLTPITPANNLIQESVFDPGFFVSQIQETGQSNRNSIFKLLENFLSSLGIGVGIMGSFCSLLNNVFALARGQRDLTGNPAQFLANFTNILGLINPQAGEVIALVQQLIGLVQRAQQNIASITSNFQSAFGSLGGGGGIGSFGITQVIQIITVAAGFVSSIRDLISGSKPVNIQGLFQLLDQIIEISANTVQALFDDFRKLSNDYKGTVETALKEAEENSVDNPGKTEEINQNNQKSLKENYSKALETTAEASKNLGPRLIQVVNQIRNGISSLAAIGILENLDQQLSRVIDQSVSRLQSKINLFTTASINNGHHFNMGSAYSKMSMVIAIAKNATRDETTDAMKNSMRGMIAQSAEKYRQKNKEEVEFVALRFCKLAGELERLYDGITQPLEQITSSFNAVNPSLSSVGNETTLRAVRAGAIRYDTQTRLQAIQQSGGIQATITSPYINGAGERSIVPNQGTTPYRSNPLTSSDYAGLPTYNEVVGRTWQGLIRYEPGPRSLASNAGNLAGGWDGLERDTLAKFVKLAKRWGSLLRVASAKRPRNDRGFHQAGKALDIYLPHNQHVRFLNMAFEEEFRGLGTYGAEAGGPFVHIDTRGATRSWTGSGGRFNYYNLRGPNGAKIG